MEFILDVLATIIAFFEAIPTFIIEFFEFLLVQYLIWQIELKIMIVKISHEAVKAVFENYELYKLISEAFNQLPDSVRYVLHSWGFDVYIKIIIEAMSTAFVIRLINR